MTVLEAVSFHVVLWIMITVGLVGNALVVLWRCTRQPSQRGSVLSTAIIILAVADFLYCVHLIMLESSVAREVFGGLNLTASGLMNTICKTSGNLSLLTSSTAMWMTLNIAIYSYQALTGRNCFYNCCSLVLNGKGCLCGSLFCQMIFTTLPIVATNICFNELFPHKYDNVVYQKSLTASDFLSTCAYAQTSQIGLFFGGNCTEWNCSDWTNQSTCHWVNVECHYGGASCWTVLFAAILASINTLLIVSCAFLYLTMCIRLKQHFVTTDSSTTRSQEVTELIKLKCRLTLIILINMVCWIPVTTVHWYVFFFNGGTLGSELFQDLTATNLVLVSLGPAVNPLIYTITGKQFIQFVWRCWKFLKCHVAIRRPGQREHDNHVIGVRRCSCIPCIQCVRPWDLDTDWLDAEPTSRFSSEYQLSDSTSTN